MDTLKRLRIALAIDSKTLKTFASENAGVTASTVYAVLHPESTSAMISDALTARVLAEIETYCHEQFERAGLRLGEDDAPSKKALRAVKLPRSDRAA